MNLISKNQSQNQSRQNLFYLPKKKAKGNLEKITFLLFEIFFEFFFKNIFRTSLEEKEIMCNLCQAEKPLFCYTCSINLSTLPVRTSKIGQNYDSDVATKISEVIFRERRDS